MKPIKNKDLKAGDWVVTPRIFNSIGKDGMLHGTFTLSKIEKIIMKNDKGGTCFVKCWWVIGEEIETTNDVPYDMKTLYLLDKQEVIDFKKRLILENLNENK